MANFSFTVYGQPRSKKNSQQVAFNRKTGKRFIRQSDSYLQYEQDISRQLYGLGLSGASIQYPVNVKCLFYRSDRRIVDLTNLLAAIDDIMVRAEVLADDNCKVIVGHDGSRVLYDPAAPRTEVTITEVIEDADV